MVKIKPVVAWAIVGVDGKLDYLDLYSTKATAMRMRSRHYDEVVVKVVIKVVKQMGDYDYDEAVLIGGNHLANAMLSFGLDPATLRGSNYESVHCQYGMLTADIWAAWHAIMEWRDVNEHAKLEPVEVNEPEDPKMAEKIAFVKGLTERAYKSMEEKSDRYWDEQFKRFAEEDKVGGVDEKGDH